MKFVAYPLAAVGLATAPSAAHASDWWLSSTNGDIFNFVDVSTIQKQGYSSRVAWSQWHSSAETFNAVRLRYDCAEKSMTILNSVSYDENGKVTRTDDTPSKSILAAPDTILWNDVAFVCDFAGSNTPENPDYGTQRLKPGQSPSQWIANLRADAAEAVRRIRRGK